MCTCCTGLIVSFSVYVGLGCDGYSVLLIFYIIILSYFVVDSSVSLLFSPISLLVYLRDYKLCCYFTKYNQDTISFYCAHKRLHAKTTRTEQVLYCIGHEKLPGKAKQTMDMF